MRRLQHHACLALWAGLNEFSEVFVTFSFLNQATMRTRQPFDKTGTKQIPCFKLTSKQYILWCQPITKSARNQLESLVYEVLLSSERTTLPFMWTQWRRLQSEKIPRDSSLCQGFSCTVLNLKVFQTKFQHFQPFQWRGQWRSWIYSRQSPEQPVGRHSPLWLQVIRKRL